MQFPVEKIADC